MTGFMRVRDRLRIYIGAHEIWIERIKNGAFSLLFLLVVAVQFGYVGVLNSWWLIGLLTIGSCFLPRSASTMLLLIDLVLNLTGISTDVSIGAGLIILLSYLFCGVYQSRRTHMLTDITSFYVLQCPFVVPLEMALLGGANDIVSVACGGVLSFYLKEAHDNAALFSDTGTSQALTAAQLITDNMISNPLFYVYMSALIVMFLTVYTIRGMNITNSWMVGVFAGSAAEFIIMLSGYLFLGMSDRILMLVIFNIMYVITGVMTTLVFLDLDYGRIEKVQFEDDDYYYYVTAVPKIRLAEEEKEIKTIES